MIFWKAWFKKIFKNVNINDQKSSSCSWSDSMIPVCPKNIELCLICLEVSLIFCCFSVSFYFIYFSYVRIETNPEDFCLRCLGFGRLIFWEDNIADDFKFLVDLRETIDFSETLLSRRFCESSLFSLFAFLLRVRWNFFFLAKDKSILIKPRRHSGWYDR